MQPILWKPRWKKWRGPKAADNILASYRKTAEEIDRLGKRLSEATDSKLQSEVIALRQLALNGTDLNMLLPEVYALTRELAHRRLGMRPFEVQVMAGVGLHHGNLIEMQTGEGKTLAAVLPAVLHALTGQGVHILTFNDYLARRDAAWMSPVYEAFGLRVGVVQAGMDSSMRKAAYAADLTYATAKEVGFDFLRSNLARNLGDIAQRKFHFAIIDEADSILIDEARVPLVIAGSLDRSGTNPYRISAIMAGLQEREDWDCDENRRNVQLTTQGTDRVEALLSCGSLHDIGNSLLLGEVNQALHAHVLLRRDVDYIVREGKIFLVDEFTGRVVADRRWPDGLQAALEAKEALAIQPGGRILASITLQHLLAKYPQRAGMTATAKPAAAEFASVYGMQVIPIPPNRPCIRDDLPDQIFTHRSAKEQAMIQEISQLHEYGRPVLVGTSSVEESEQLAAMLTYADIPCRVLNAKNDEAEAEIVAEAGAVGAVTISTNMAGRGTDIRLGGADEKTREHVVALGGLYVIGTNRHESRRIDDQLRGRAGRQGDPGSSRFFVSLEDPLMVRFGIDGLIPQKLRPAPQEAPIDHPIIRREVERLQRIVDGQNQDIRSTLTKYSSIVEQQRATLFDWRRAVLTGEAELSLFPKRAAGRFAELLKSVGVEKLREIEHCVTLHHIDAVWADHLDYIAQVREGIHLVSIGGLDPLNEFLKKVAPAFRVLHQEIEDRTCRTLMALEVNERGQIDSTLRGPSSTWTYLINDRAVTELHRMLHGVGSCGMAAAGILVAWPFMLGWGLWRLCKKRP